MSKFPIDKPTAEEMQRLVPYPIQPKSTHDTTIIRYGLSYPPVEPGQCGQWNRVIEVHLPADGEPATWWELFGSDRLRAVGT